MSTVLIPDKLTDIILESKSSGSFEMLCICKLVVDYLVCFHRLPGASAIGLFCLPSAMSPCELL